MSIHSSSELSFAVPAATWQAFRDGLLAARTSREEVIGFFFCTRHPLTSGRCRFLPRTWIVPSRECYAAQSTGGLELRQDFHQYLVDTYVRRGLDVVHIHTHPGLAPPHFSGVDDVHEAEYARFLATMPTPPVLLSGVFNEHLEHGHFRAWLPGEQQPFPAVTFSTDWLPLKNAVSQGDADDPRFDRQRVFGTAVQQSLGQMTVGLIGCGGIGAVFAEQLARLGVRRWVLVDPDHLDETNLNRMPFATPAMAKSGWSKVRYLKQLIQRAWPADATIRTLRVDVNQPRVEGALAVCDLIVAATDNQLSRMIAQKIALRYLRPLISLGTLIVPGGPEGAMKLYSRVTMPPAHGGWCLMCSGVIDAVAAATEAAPPEMAGMVREAGYVPDVAAPAVYWLNSVCAALGVQAVHGALCGFVDVSRGLDWTEEMLEGKRFRIVYPPYPDCLHCSCDGDWAAGPRSPNRRRNSTVHA